MASYNLMGWLFWLFPSWSGLQNLPLVFLFPFSVVDGEGYERQSPQMNPSENPRASREPLVQKVAVRWASGALMGDFMEQSLSFTWFSESCKRLFASPCQCARVKEERLPQGKACRWDEHRVILDTAVASGGFAFPWPVRRLEDSPIHSRCQCFIVCQISVFYYKCSS